MRTKIVVSTALASFAALVAAADGDKAIVQGDGANDIGADAWKAVAESPTNSSTSKFTGFDITKAFPSSEQDGWELSIDVKENVEGPDGNVTATVMSINPASGNGTINDSWQFCVYAFNVKASSAYAYHSGQENSCDNLVTSECVDDLKKNGAKAAAQGCKGYSSTASCLRDIAEQSAMALSLSAQEASDAFGKNATFFRRVDGGVEAFATAAGNPMLVVTVFGSTEGDDMSPTAEAACVLPNAKEGAASRASALVGISVTVTIMVLQLVL